MSDGRLTGVRGPGRPPAQGLVSRRELLRAAREVFSQHGYNATTLKGIASRVGVTRPALIYHFHSKRNLYEELLISADRAMRDLMERALAAPTFVRQLLCFVETLSDDIPLTSFLVSAAADVKRHPGQWPASHDITSTINGFVAVALRGAVRRGELSEAPTAVSIDLVAAMVMGLLLETVCSADKPLDAVFGQFAALLTGSWHQ